MEEAVAWSVVVAGRGGIFVDEDGSACGKSGAGQVEGGSRVSGNQLRNMSWSAFAVVRLPRAKEKIRQQH